MTLNIDGLFLLTAVIIIILSFLTSLIINNMSIFLLIVGFLGVLSLFLLWLKYRHKSKIQKLIDGIKKR